MTNVSKEKLTSKHFLTIGQLSSEEIYFLLDEAVELKTTKGRKAASLSTRKNIRDDI